MISDSDLNKVREATDIVALMSERTQVKQRGRDFWCCCPIHDEKTPSCKIDPSTGLWHCFGCGEGGDVFSFMMKLENMSFVEAVLALAQRAGIDVEQNDGKRHMSMSAKGGLIEVCEATADFYHTQLMRLNAPAADEARAYLAARGFGGEVPGKWNLGFAPGNSALVHYLRGKGFTPQQMLDANVAVKSRTGGVADRFYNRIMFPICDVSGQCIAFGGRVVGVGKPKYLNSQETPIFHKSRTLYGLDRAKSAMAALGSAIVVEGYTDVIALHEASIENAVATLGTALTMQHIRILSRHAGKKIVYLFDGDEAGQRAAERALQFIDASMTPEAGASKIELCACTLPDNLDPAEFVAARGASELNRLVEAAPSLLQYGIDRKIASHNLDTAEGRSRAMVDAISILAPIKGSILAKEYAVQIAGRVRVRESDALEMLANLKPAAKNNSEGVTGGVPVQVPARTRTKVHLSAEEKSRLYTEREFLSMAAKHPQDAIFCLDAMLQIKWHDTAHSQMAASILQTLSENLTATPAEIITCAQRACPHASDVLTSADDHAEAPPAQVLNYLLTDLQIGDVEAEISSIKAQLAAGGQNTAGSADDLFAKLVNLQNQISNLRANRNQI
jgi:DNA primase